MRYLTRPLDGVEWFCCLLLEISYQMRSLVLAVLIILVTSLTFVNGIDSDVYFYVEEHVKRCFFEELPNETILLGAYKHVEDSRKPLWVHVYQPDGEKVYTERAEAKGRFAYHSVVGGQHKVCIESSNDKPWPVNSKAAKFHLKLEIHGSDPELAAETAKKEHLTSLEKELTTLDNKVDLILKELEYSKQQEQHFRDQSERINSRVMWWSLLQTLVLLLSGIWQIVHLKNFFRAKKLV